MRAGTAPPLLLVRGDLALAVPAAERLVAAIAAEWKIEPARVRQPGELAALADDLRTFSMFASGKLVLATATGALADRDVAADLVADALKAKFRAGSELDGAAREAALRLLQVVRLHDLEPASAPPEAILAALPDALFGGKKGGAAEQARAELAPLLAAALEAGLTGIGESEASILADVLRDGLPERHLLVLAESAVASSHPLVVALDRRGGVIDAGRLEVARNDWAEGLDTVFAELGAATNTRIDSDAARELARRTLRPEDFRKGGGPKAVEAESVGRLAAEFRKLAGLSGGQRIDRELVEANVDDRGQEEVWITLDAIGDGKSAMALSGIRRRIQGSEDPLAERLQFFALLSNFVRQVVQTHGVMASVGIADGTAQYGGFKQRILPRLKGKIQDLESNPLARVSDYRLFKAYVAAGRREATALARWPAKLLETERKLKGDSDDPDTALELFVIELARVKSPTASAPRGRLR